MTILEALQVINTYPIATTHLEVVCIDRDLTSTVDYTKVIGSSQGYQLATADTYLYLANHPNIVEAEVGINNAPDIKKQFLGLANKIYKEYDDPKFTGFTYGFIGDDFNG